MAKEKLNDAVNENRAIKYKKVIANRQEITIILENVYDPHNIGAVVRSCDAVGISEIFIVETTINQNLAYKKVGKNSSSGARKWIKTHCFENLESCFTEVRSRYKKIFGTHLSTESVSLYDLELTDPVALMFGNEQLGLSSEALTMIDGNFIIPQYGMVQSLNISVACAVSLFEASRQRSVRNMYNQPFDDKNTSHSEMFDWFASKHIDYVRNKEK